MRNRGYGRDRTLEEIKFHAMEEIKFHAMEEKIQRRNSYSDISKGDRNIIGI